LLQKKSFTSILRFYVGIKGDKDNPRYTLLGGKLNEGENWKESIQREVSEEAGLRFLGLRKQTIVGSWDYTSDKSGKRQVMLTYNPVLSCEQITIGDPKIKDVATLKLGEFDQLVREGQLNDIPLEGHLSINEQSQDTITISANDKKRQQAALFKALGWMGHIEQYLQKRFERILSNGGTTISEDEFKAEYEKIVSEFMRKGFEAGVRRKDESGLENRHELIEILDSGYLGKDILYYLPELATHGIDWTGIEKSTEGTQVFAGYLKGIFSEFLAKESLTTDSYRSEMKNPNVSLADKTQRINALDLHFKSRLKEVFNLEDSDLTEVAGYIQNFFRDLSGEMKVADPKLTTGLHQDFILLNEVNNANFGYLLSLFLGVDTKENTKEADRLIRFEAGRQLFLLLKGLSGITHYKTEVGKVREGRLQAAINNFFGSIVTEEIVSLDAEQNMRVRVRQKAGKKIIVDEKPIKNFTSFLRKSLEERVSDICDFHTISVAFKNRDENNLEDSERLIQEFQQFLVANFPDSSLLVSDKRSYGTRDYFEPQKEKREVDGKRKGSQGSKFVRTKLVFHLDQEQMELIVYPLFTIPEESGKFWGWLETRKDDKDYVVRRLLAGQNGIPSTYDLLLPPDLYPHNFKHKLHSGYHNSA